MKQREPGLYVGMPAEEYHADPAVGSSGIKQLIERPYRYWYWSPLNPDRPEQAIKKPLKFGTAYHTLMLEPEKFDYQIKFGVKESLIPGTLGEGEWDKLQRMKNILYSKPRRAALLSEGVAEVSYFWRDAATGIMCKVRFDLFAPSWIVDLKTAASVTDQALRYTIPDYGYDVSGAMYSIGAQELKKAIRAGYKMPRNFSKKFIDEFLSHDNQIFAFMLQEKDEPFMTRCQILTPEVAACGRDKFRAGLDAYAKLEKDGWQDDYPDIEEMDIDKISTSINYF